MDEHKRRLIVMGDRVLISPVEGEERTKVGLYLPQTVVEKEAVQSGRIAATGPGTPMPRIEDLDSEPWKPTDPQVKHVPMQAQVGDYAIYLRKASVEIKYEGNKYVVIPQSAILVLLREDNPTD